jgi:hypothetical protein
MPRVRVPFFLLALAALLAGVAIASTSASAEEKIEAPFWKVQGKRLGAEHTKKAGFEIGPEETIIRSLIKETKVEIRCKGLTSKEGSIIGSNPGSDLTMSATLLLKGCTFWVLGVQEPGCEVPNIETPKLAVKGWYEGTKSAAGTKLVLLFEEQLIAKILIKAIKLCPDAGTYALEGSFAANLEPQNSEVKTAKIKIPAIPIKTVWQAQGTGEERFPKLTFGGQPAIGQGILLLGLESGEEFGGFSK